MPNIKSLFNPDLQGAKYESPPPSIYLFKIKPEVISHLGDLFNFNFTEVIAY
jgi:hypothetical protein